MMYRDELVSTLGRLSKKIHTDDPCFGCGYESSICAKGGCTVLSEAAEQLTEKSPWNRVEDKLPEIYLPVIVRRPGGKVEQGWLDPDGWWRVYGARTRRVTHWMPMPEAPRGGE